MPDLPLLLGWVLVGWCGTVPWWVKIKFPPPPPPPDPDPWWRDYLVGGVLGAIGGAIGGWVFGQLFTLDFAEIDAASMLLTFAGAFVGARLVTDVANLAMGSRTSAR
jgi:hypothetical protein